MHQQKCCLHITELVFSWEIVCEKQVLCCSRWQLCRLRAQWFSISLLSNENRNFCRVLLIRSVRSSTGISLQSFARAKTFHVLKYSCLVPVVGACLVIGALLIHSPLFFLFLFFSLMCVISCYNNFYFDICIVCAILYLFLSSRCFLLCFAWVFSISI